MSDPTGSEPRNQSGTNPGSVSAGRSGGGSVSEPGDVSGGRSGGGSGGEPGGASVGRSGGEPGSASAGRSGAASGGEPASPSGGASGNQSAGQAASQSGQAASQSGQAGQAQSAKRAPAARGPAPVAVALDAPDLETAARWAALVTPHVSTVKIGLELYLRYGPDVVASVRGASGVQVFLDLKLHDIPATVAGAARAVARLRPHFLTVHAVGGPDVIRAAVEAAPATRVAAVTVLTSLGDGDLDRLGVAGPVGDAVRRLAVLAVEAGARGLVCSPQEVAAVRAEVGPDVTLITPGVRPAGAAANDQARIATPEEAVRAGADLLVIGRPITSAPDPGAAAAAVAASLRRLALSPT